MNTNNIRTIATGKAFGINVFTNQGEYEIATFLDMILALIQSGASLKLRQ
jgi:hypothetical protein